MSTQQSSSGDPQRLAQEIEDIEYLNDVMAARLASIETANDERIPGAVVDRLMEGEAPLLVWREHRGLSREALAEAAGVSVTEIDLVEQGGGDPGLRKMVALAKALRIDAEELLPWLETAPTN